MKQKMLDKFGDIKDKISNVFTDEKLQQKMTSLQYTFSELNQDTSTIPSLYYDTTSQKITKKTNGVIFIALVSFHQKKGSIVEYTYPSKEAILSSQTDFFDSLKRIEGDKQIDVSNEEILNDIENQLSAFCLPDGIHVVNRDTEFFIIQNYNKVLYCTFSYRQIRTNDNNNIIDDFQENTRDCVQKSLCIISTVPLFMYYYEKINVAMDLFMNQKILNDKSAIDSLYKDIAEKKESISMKYFKFYNFFSYRKLIQFINDDLIVLLKYILLEKKIIVFSHNPQNSTLFILSLLSLLPSGLFFNFDPEQKEAKDISIFRKSQKQIGFPFMLFNNQNMLYPIFTLFDLDFITKLNLNGFLLGTSNALVIKTKEIKADCIINLDESKIYYEEDSVEEKAIKLTDKEKALLNLIKSTVEIKEKDNKRELKGDWLIYDNKSQNEKIINENVIISNILKEYFTELVYEISLCIYVTKKEFNVKEQTAKTEDTNEEEQWTEVYQAGPLQTLESKIESESLNLISKNLSEFNIYFISLWVETNNFKAWYNTQDPTTGYRSKNAKYSKEITIFYENGDTYCGGIYHGKKLGKGTYYYADSDLTYIGTFEKDKRKGKGNLSSKDNKYLYEGEWNNDMFNGSGSLITSNIKYTGTFQNGLFEGEGNMVDSSGQLYQGSFKQGKKNGFGILTFLNGDVFEGYFENDTFNGTGQLKRVNGGRESGVYVNGQIEGEGIITNKDGTIYVGSIKNGKPFGRGKIMDSSGKLLKEGDWSEENKNI